MDNVNETPVLDERENTPSEPAPIPKATAAESAPEPNADPAVSAELDALKSELAQAKIRISLLLSGILREKLDEGTALAQGLCGAGKTPEEAAAEIIEEYPHLKAVRREIPQFAASGSGSGDGFAAIRKIFAGR